MYPIMIRRVSNQFIPAFGGLLSDPGVVFNLHTLGTKSKAEQDISKIEADNRLPVLEPREKVERLLSFVPKQLVPNSESVAELSLEVCDGINDYQSGHMLLTLGEFAASKFSPEDFALLSCVFERSRIILNVFSPSEFVGLLSLAARVEFVDSNFNQSIQEYLPSVLTSFSDNHFPIILSSILRLGIDQPVDRIPSESDSVTQTIPQSSPLLVQVISETIPRVSRISESGCLSMLHAVIRRPKTKITPEMDDLVYAVSEKSNISNWSLGLRIQAVHALSRFGIHDPKNISSLLSDVDSTTVKKIPSANLQHLLSIIHNHADKLPEELWMPVLEVCIARMGEPMIARSMPMSTLAVTLSYVGRLGLKNTFVVNALLNVFCGLKPRPKSPGCDVIIHALVTRILGDNQVDIAHLASIMESLEKLGMWELPPAVPLAMTTRRFLFRDGIHNVKAAPLCLIGNVFIRNDFGLSDDSVSVLDQSIDRAIDGMMEHNNRNTNWSLKTQAELVSTPDASWRKMTVLTILEGLLKHEQYIRSTPSAINRCMGLKSAIEETANQSGFAWSSVPENVRSFIDSLESL